MPIDMKQNGLTYSSFDRRIPQLDGLRGLAIILVIIGHYFAEVPHGLSFFGPGWLGVDLFFVLSGFLIGGILLRNKSSNSFFSTFYIRRICRIIPIYYLILTLTLIVITNEFLYFNAWNRGTLPIATYFSFTQNIYMSYAGLQDTPWLLPTWTLAVEEQFYLILPLIIRFVPERLLLRVVVVLILFAPILRMLLLFSGVMHKIAVYVLLPCRWDLLFLGVLAAIIQRDKYLRMPLLARGGLPLKVGTLAAALVVFFLFFSDWYYGVPVRDTIGLVPLGLCFGCYILLITSGFKEGRFFCSGFWRFFGSISYGLYLIHQPIAGFLHGFLLGKPPDIDSIPQILVTLLALMLSVFISWISWNLFESRLVAFGRQWGYHSSSCSE